MSIRSLLVISTQVTPSKRLQKQASSHRGVEMGIIGFTARLCAHTKAVLGFQCQLARGEGGLSRQLGPKVITLLNVHCGLGNSDNAQLKAVHITDATSHFYILEVEINVKNIHPGKSG